jgi:hypothetical protein
VELMCSKVTNLDEAYFEMPQQQIAGEGYKT